MQRRIYAHCRRPASVDDDHLARVLFMLGLDVEAIFMFEDVLQLAAGLADALEEMGCQIAFVNARRVVSEQRGVL
jgi:hypothetical protein